MKVVYIASPYTHGNTSENVSKHMAAVDEVIRLGFAPIAPLLFHFQGIYYPQTYDKWLEICVALMERADIVLRLAGYSPGADREVQLAKKLGIPVEYYYPQSLLKYE